MKNFTGKLKILFLAAFSPVLMVCGQEEILQFAGHAYGTGNYSLAIREYQRALFFHPELSPGPLLEKIGDAWFRLGDLPRAIEFYDHASRQHLTDTGRYHCLLRKVFCQVLEGRYQYALVDLFSLNDSLPPAVYREYQFYLGTCFYHLGSFGQARQAFMLALPEDRQDARNTIDEIFSDPEKFRRPNPKTALWMSILLPGAGQFYAGDIRNGLNSMLLNAGLAALFINTAINYTFTDALITIFPWFQRYYQGGFTRAEDIALQRREEKREEVYREILDVIRQCRMICE